MNKESLSGNYNEMAGKIKAAFGKLTDNQIMVSKGKAQEIVGELQQAYGYSKERAEQEWKKFEERECSDKSKDSCCN